jgi:carbonic anhydrase/acetyltransferase-like protein (isoleucine patch superfamily)
MLKKELIAKNPIRHLQAADGGQMGLVIARAGLGKTAILVQIALYSLLQDRQVVHVSIGESLDKARLWYDDMFRDIVVERKLDNAGELHDATMRNRMIITFNATSFNRAKLEERLNDLIQQNVIKPSCMVVDGIDFAKAGRQMLEGMREMARNMNLTVWFSARSHREDERRSAAGVPAPCHEVEDLFDTVVLLQPAPQKNCIDLNIIKGPTGVDASGTVLKLDPMTFMIKEGCE